VVLVDSSYSTRTTRRVTSDEWTVRPLLVAPFVLLLASGQVLLITRWVVLVEEELSTRQK
jgi:hypothetical protein